MKRVNYFLTGIALTFAVSCVAPEEWHAKYDNVVPGPVTIVDVQNVTGGAIIYYTLPADMEKKDLLGAKVVYSLKPEGEVLEKFSSAESNSIELEGYGDTNERKVTVYAVHKNGKISTGVEAIVKPDTPAIITIRETLQAKPTFGGIQLTWNNPLSKPMTLILFVEDPVTREMVEFDMYSSDAVEGKTVFRHFEVQEHKFRVEMYDRWKNPATPFETILTPLEEVEILGIENGVQTWQIFDAGRVSGGSGPWRWAYRCDIHNNPDNSDTRNRGFNMVLDTRVDNNAYWCPGALTPAEFYVPGLGDKSFPFPLYVTFDMGRKAVYSRMKLVARQRGLTDNPPAYYSAALPIVFHIWGTNDPKKVEDVEDPHGIYPKGSRQANQAYWSSWDLVDGTDAWKDDGWVQLATCHLLLSSGQGEYYGNMPLTSNDIEKYLSLGYDFDFNMEVIEPFRYLRWEILATNTGQKEIHLCRLRYWGNYPE